MAGPTKKKRTGRNFTEKEIEYIKEFADKQTQYSIAQELDCDPKSISYYIKKFGLKKFDGKEKTTEQIKQEKRQKFFINHLANTHFWEEAEKSLMDYELDFYIAEWTQLSEQFKDILSTEKRQIHDYIINEIIGNRYLRKIKFWEDQITELQNKVELLNKVYDVQDDEAMQEYEQDIRELASLISSQNQILDKQHLSNLSQKQQILAHLNARRKDRVDSAKEASKNIFGLIQEMNDEKVREGQKKLATAHKKAGEKKLADWSTKKVTFPDGKKDKMVKVVKD